MEERRYITSMDEKEAKSFFMKNESYCNIDLPKYFNFEPVLLKIDGFLKEVDEKKIKDIINKNKLFNNSDINCKIYANKDGKFDWRPLEIINPYIYVYLVNFLTKKEVWCELIESLKNNKVESIRVASIPVEALGKSKDRKEQILNWWNEVEQESIVMGLEFNNVIHLDISNCYGSIYTHSIPWAIHGKEAAKKDKSDVLIGNKIDKIVRYMQNNQTNGIPQGSIIMDFIAEIVLSYADKLIYNELKINNINPNNYSIIRYRDDYRVFTNSDKDTNIITRVINNVLIDLNFKLNSKKTMFSDDVIMSSLKKDKIHYQEFASTLYFKDNNGNYIFNLNHQKHLFQILMFSKKFPNSGSVMKMLDEFNKMRTHNLTKVEYTNTLQCISIVVEIMINNTKAIPLCISILSHFIVCLTDDDKEKILRKILNKVNTLPNIDMINIWLQRLTIKDNKDMEYSSLLCKLIYSSDISIFNKEWIKTKKYLIDDQEIINDEYISMIDNELEIEEVSIFNY